MGAVWKNTLRLGDVWRDEDREFTERRDEIVKRIQKLPQFKTDDSLQMLVEDMSDCEDTDSFDYVWDEFYDWADDERVWVDTIS